jgi:hypothetical protein
MFRQEMPRVYELRALIADPSDRYPFFQNFDDSIRDEPCKKQVWLAREREFQRLDQESWQFLKSEARPYLMTRDVRRWWQQLISILNQARAHNYLSDEGCLGVHFIPRSKSNGEETPDLEGVLNGMQVLCEVKTVHISDAEATRCQTGGVGSTTNSLDEGFFKKLSDDLLKAKSQMESYESKGNVRRIAFVVLKFDDFLGEYKADYYEQIDRHLAANPLPCVDIVFYNERTAFHCYVAMQNAVVVNEVS